MNTDELQPWEQQPDESFQAFEAFVTYRDMPRAERSIRAVAQKLGKSATLIAKWSSAHAWGQRCREYDRDQDRILRAKRLERSLANLEEIDTLGRALRLKAARALNAIPVEKIGAYAIVQMAKIGAELAVLARQEHAELAEQTQDTLPTDGYDVLDSLRANPDVAPILIRLQESGVDLEPDAGDAGGDAESGPVAS